ncbi:MAG: hypothetical protein LUD48_00520 [Prevotella sp.]|nr:hypothetical protein [Prevotella sp.]
MEMTKLFYVGIEFSDEKDADFYGDKILAFPEMHRVNNRRFESERKKDFMDIFTFFFFKIDMIMIPKEKCIDYDISHCYVEEEDDDNN